MPKKTSRRAEVIHKAVVTAHQSAIQTGGMTIRILIGTMVRTLRKATRKSQAELARLAKVGDHQVASVEKGRPVRNDIVKNILSALVKLPQLSKNAKFSDTKIKQLDDVYYLSGLLNGPWSK